MPPAPELIVPSAGRLVGAEAQAIRILDADGIAVLFELAEADISVDGLSIPLDWLAATTSVEHADAVERAIARDYPPEALAGIRIQGLARAADAVHWLRALKLRTANGPTRRTTLALIKT